MRRQKVQADDHSFVQSRHGHDLMSTHVVPSVVLQS